MSTTPKHELVEWNGPEGESHAVFELGPDGKRTSDDPVSTGNFHSETAFVQRARWTAAARELGCEHARNAASWVTDGNESDDSRRHKLYLIESGDGEDLDEWLPARPNLSGEWADNPTPRSLFEDLTGLDAHAEATWNADAYNALVDELSDAYESGVDETFSEACETELRKWLGDGTREASA